MTSPRVLLAVLAVLAATPAGATPAAGNAAAHPVLVELFTSQGCSSCPPADAFVRALPSLGFGRDRVVPLTFHVDYWDGLGWKDPFASPRFTERQRAYVSSGLLASPPGEEGLQGAYTPQMIVGGRVHFSGARRDVALAELRRALAAPEQATLVASAAVGQGDASAEVIARVTAPSARPEPGAAGRSRGAAPGDWRVFVALAQKEARTPVGHGENAGETLVEADIVRWLSPALPISTAGAPVRITAPRPRDLPWRELDLVVFVQAASTGRIVSVRSLAVTPAH